MNCEKRRTRADKPDNVTGGGGGGHRGLNTPVRRQVSAGVKLRKVSAGQELIKRRIKRGEKPRCGRCK